MVPAGSRSNNKHSQPVWKLLLSSSLVILVGLVLFVFYMEQLKVSVCCHSIFLNHMLVCLLLLSDFLFEAHWFLLKIFQKNSQKQSFIFILNLTCEKVYCSNNTDYLVAGCRVIKQIGGNSAFVGDDESTFLAVMVAGGRCMDGCRTELNVCGTMQQGLGVFLKNRAHTCPVFWCRLMLLAQDFSFRKIKGTFCNFMQRKCLVPDCSFEDMRKAKVQKLSQ